jgi:hypothetical protein
MLVAACDSLSVAEVDSVRKYVIFLKTHEMGKNEKIEKLNQSHMILRFK